MIIMTQGLKNLREHLQRNETCNSVTTKTVRYHNPLNVRLQQSPKDVDVVDDDETQANK